ncbi:DUF308 domain-containing protein [uncultured Bradyrhizobium sp.]|uniref:DUF308 domain-containing protein n=1 Tax=uncultured Bradyrhizobium sp. TaxID=199684 RepID=UPI0035CC0D85
MTLIAGIGILVAGLVAIGFGIQDKEFEVGKTLILAGTVVACTGGVMLVLAVVVRELQNIARRLGPVSAAAARAQTEPQPSAAATGNQAGPGTLDAAEPMATPAPPSSPASWPEEVAARDTAHLRGDGASEPAMPGSAAATKPRRNLLFSSSSRRERERAMARAPEAPAADAGSAPVAAPTAKEAASATFEDAWPQSERPRSDPLRRPRTPSTFAEPATAASTPERAAAMVRNEEPPPVTVLKSGVVDGMAYSLYSDGSIEAQMPEGMMRFASIDELRSHLDQRP